MKYSMVEPSGKTLIVRDKRYAARFENNKNIFEYVKLETQANFARSDEPAGAANKYRLVSDNEDTLTLRGDDGGEFPPPQWRFTIYNVGDSVATEDVGNGFTVTKALTRGRCIPKLTYSPAKKNRWTVSLSTTKKMTYSFERRRLRGCRYRRRV